METDVPRAVGVSEAATAATDWPSRRSDRGWGRATARRDRIPTISASFKGLRPARGARAARPSPERRAAHLARDRVAVCCAVLRGLATAAVHHVARVGHDARDGHADVLIEVEDPLVRALNHHLRDQRLLDGEHDAVDATHADGRRAARRARRMRTAAWETRVRQQGGMCRTRAVGSTGERGVAAAVPRAPAGVHRLDSVLDLKDAAVRRVGRGRLVVLRCGGGAHRRRRGEMLTVSHVAARERRRAESARGADARSPQCQLTPWCLARKSDKDPDFQWTASFKQSSG
jgi:hypothetical protein